MRREPSGRAEGSSAASYGTDLSLADSGPGSAAASRRDDLGRDFGRLGDLTMPGERTKNGVAHVVPLSECVQFRTSGHCRRPLDPVS